MRYYFILNIFMAFLPLTTMGQMIPFNNAVEAHRADSMGVTFQKAAVRVGSLCSGVLISPHIVMTAGHCFMESTASSIFFHSDTLEQDDSLIKRAIIDYYVSESYFVAPTEPSIFKGYKPFVENDFGLILVDKAAPVDYPFFPLASLDQKFSQFVRVGFGYRLDKDGLVDISIEQPIKVDEVTLYDSKNWGLSSRRIVFNQPSQKTCGGDSGGAILGLDGNQWYLVGVVSGVSQISPNDSLLKRLLTKWWEASNVTETCGKVFEVESVAIRRDQIRDMSQALILRNQGDE